MFSSVNISILLEWLIKCTLLFYLFIFVFNGFNQDSIGFDNHYKNILVKEISCFSEAAWLTIAAREDEGTFLAIFYFFSQVSCTI